MDMPFQKKVMLDICPILRTTCVVLAFVNKIPEHYGLIRSVLDQIEDMWWLLLQSSVWELSAALASILLLCSFP